MAEYSDPVSVGVGGWAYLPGKHRNKLEVCSKLYNFVEVNSSFYKLPPIDLVKRWRASVPEEFQFSLRAHGKLTHQNHLEPTNENFRELEKNIAICRVLKAFVLHFQFPPSFEVTNIIVEKWRGFFSTLRDEKGLNYAFEVRNQSSKSNSGLQSFIRDNDIIPCGDISREDVKPSADSKIMYSRVFGHGDHTKWSFATSELVDLKDRVTRTKANRKYVTFHNITMYEDAARLREILKPGSKDFSGSSSGIESLKEALLAERIEFPITGQELTSRIAWRTITTSEGRRIHANEITIRLPQKDTFESLDEILAGCKSFVELSGPIHSKSNFAVLI